MLDKSRPKAASGGIIRPPFPFPHTMCIMWHDLIVWLHTTFPTGLVPQCKCRTASGNEAGLCISWTKCMTRSPVYHHPTQNSELTASSWGFLGWLPCSLWLFITTVCLQVRSYYFQGTGNFLLWFDEVFLNTPLTLAFVQNALWFN